MPRVDVHTMVSHGFGDLVDDGLSRSLNAEAFFDFRNVIAERFIVVYSINF